MHRLFKPKTIRRMLVFAAMMAPAVYLFGSQFFALAGAHGEQLFAEPVYAEEYVEVDSFVADGSCYRYTLVDDERLSWFDEMRARLNNGSNSFVDFVLNANSYIGFNFAGSPSQASWLNLIISNTGGVIQNTTLISVNSDGVYSPRQNSPWIFTFDGAGFSGFITSDGVLEKAVLVPTSVVPENNSAYTDYLFGNFFMKDNFLVEWGENAISENPKGFAPFGYFWRYIDNNMLHLSDDQMGLMAYGYMYYAGHVLLFDVGFILVTFFLSFIQRMADRFGGDA